MNIEQLEALRDWVRAEIECVIAELNTGADGYYMKHIREKLDADRKFSELKYLMETKA